MDQLGMHLRELSMFAGGASHIDTALDVALPHLEINKNDPRYSEVLRAVETHTGSKSEMPRVGERFHVLRFLSGVKYFIQFAVLNENKDRRLLRSGKNVPKILFRLRSGAVSDVYKVWSRTYEKFVLANELICSKHPEQGMPEGNISISDIISQVASKRHGDDREIIYDTCARLNEYNPLKLTPQNNARLVIAYAFSSLFYVRTRELCLRGVACPSGYENGFNKSAIREFSKKFINQDRIKPVLEKIINNVSAEFFENKSCGSFDIETLAHLAYYLNALSTNIADKLLCDSVFGQSHETYGIVPTGNEAFLITENMTTPPNGFDEQKTQNSDDGDDEIKRQLNLIAQKGDHEFAGQNEIDKYGQDKFEYGPEERAAIEKVFSIISN